MSSQDISEFQVVHQFPEYLIFQRKDDPLLYIYKEYQIPTIIGNTQKLSPQQLQQHLSKRQKAESQGILKLQRYILDQSDKMGLLFESFVKNFDEELSIRRGTTNFWPEEELLNTFQACLASLKSFHDLDIIHSGLGPQSIIFSQEGFVKLADNFVISQDFRRNWYPSQDQQQLEFGFWPPEIVNDWTIETGWKIEYETVEADLWALGLIFLEAVTLQSNYEIYYLEEQDQKLMINSELLEERINQMYQNYSESIGGLVAILLSPNEEERSWNNILQFFSSQEEQCNKSFEEEKKSLNQMDDMVKKHTNKNDDARCKFEQHAIMSQKNANDQQKLIQEYGLQNKKTDDVSVRQNESTNDIGSQSQTKITDMLENCIQKSKDLILMNDSIRKDSKYDNGSYFTLNQQQHYNNKNRNESITQQTQQTKNSLDTKVDTKLESSLQNKGKYSSNQSFERQLNSYDQNEFEESKKKEHQFQIPEQEEQEEVFKDITNNLNEQRYGVIEYENDIHYKGQIYKSHDQQNTIKHGFGSLMHNDGNLLYQGEWEQDNFQGHGFLYNFALDEIQSINDVCDYKDFSNLGGIWIKYQGEFEQGVMNGKGQMSFIDGSIFQGYDNQESFVQGTIDGYGMYVSKEGNLVFGQWKENQLMTLLS